MRIVFVFSFFLFLLKQTFGQIVYTGEFQSPENPYYWKNNKALPKDYYQQDVHYQLDVAINDSLDNVSGSYNLTYTNNSPDELKELYFHLYDNAFQPKSYYHQLWIDNKQEPKFGKNEAKGLATLTNGWKVNGKEVKTELDNTIIKIYLNEPLKPNEKAEISCQFTTYWDNGSMRRRNNKYVDKGFKHFNAVHWYPIICVYDEQFKWHTDQHLDKEFYADFGSFDVKLTFPHQYIVEATGVLQNEDEVLPSDLKEKLNLENYKSKPFNSAPSVIIQPEKGKTKTWHYKATNVHNFAFTADPTYRFKKIKIGETEVIALAQEHHASKWQESATFAAKVMEVYGKDFGNYIWPKIIVADADDGMEYPMLTLDGGVYPQHQYLLAHEIGHMWFYGMLGSNETYRAFLDEGFTQFLTIWSMDKIVGKKKFVPAPYKKLQKYTDSSESKMDRLYSAYLNDVWSGYDEPLNTHSHGFNSGIRQSGGYRLTYMKTGVMLYNLKYVLGDSLFLAAMQHYVKKWTGAHPYPQDFRKAITEVAKTDLTWFFDQWLETTKNINYAIEKVRFVGLDSLKQRKYNIIFRRKGRMQMPIDFTVLTDSGKRFNYHIPNNWFIKKTDATILPKWYGWDLLNRTYKAKITLKSPIKNIIIDTTKTLADYDLTDNRYFDNAEITLKHNVPNPPNWYKMRYYFKPVLWWNRFDGLQLGFGYNSDYYNQKFWQDFSIWGNSRVLQNDIPTDAKNKPSYISFSYQNRINLSQIWKQLFVTNELQYHSGALKHSFGFEKTFRYQDLRNPRFTKIYISHNILYREKNSDSLYLLYPNYWQIGKINSFITFGIQRNYPLKNGSGMWNLEARTPGLYNDFNYSYLQYTLIHQTLIDKLDIKYRFFARIGTGTTPLESALYLAGAAPESYLSNKITRASGFVPNEWLGYGANVNHFQMGGGLNLRGYAGYLLPVEADGNQYFNNVGKSGMSFSLEIDFDKYIPLKIGRASRFIHIDPYLFHDMGILSYEKQYINQGVLAASAEQFGGTFRSSSGVGTALTLKIPELNIKPFTIRFDMPLLLSHTPYNTENMAFRYLVGINRSF